MRRNNIAKSINRITHALTDSDLPNKLREALRKTGPSRERSEFNTPLLEALNRFSIEFRQFNDLELNIAKILKLEGLADPNNWEGLIELKEDPSRLFEVHRQVDFAAAYLPLFCEIIVPDYIRYDISKEELELKTEENKGILSCVLYDNGSVPFTIDRFISLFLSISTLYEVSSQVIEQRDVPLVLIGCDSGDEKSFDFLGAAKVIQMVKEIILSLWDRVVFYREIKLSRHFDLISQSLPIIEKIEQLKKSKEIGPEEAEILKRKVLSSVEDFISSGAITPEMEAVSKFDPILLMTPEPKQLTEGKDTEDEDTLSKDR